MVDDLEYFSDTVIIGYCGTCKEEIYQGDETNFNLDTGEWFCCSKCAEKFIEVQNVPEHEQFKAICPYCNESLTSEFEAVKCDSLYFCDSSCVLNYYGITRKEASNE